jgi:hypothetical protein
VITSRTQEYGRVNEDARVNMQIEIRPSSVEQLESELSQMGVYLPEAIPLLNAIRQNPLLREIAGIPFYFNSLQLLYASKLPVFSSHDLIGLKDEILQKLITSALQNATNKDYTPKLAFHWLSFLSFNMNQRQKVDFELQDLQYDWWNLWSNQSLHAARFINGLIGGLFGGLIGGLVVGAVSSLFIGLTGGMTIGLSVGLISILNTGIKDNLRDGKGPKINTHDFVRWSLEAYIESVAENFLLGLFCGLCTGLMFSGGVGVGVGVGVLLGVSLNEMVRKESFDFIQIASPYQRFYYSMKVLYFSILQHWHLRYLLYKKGAIPLHLVDFLNEMSSRYLMETDGATWRFRHRIIQDYFAEQWKEPEQKK